MPLRHMAYPKYFLGPRVCELAHRGIVVVIAGALLGSLSSCESREAIASYRVPKEQPPAVRKPPAAAPIQWTLPPGWKQVEDSTPMRYATIAVNDATPPLLLTISELPRQELLANVNRWEAQVGAPLSTSETLPSVSRSVEEGPLRADLVDVSGPSDRMLGALVQREANTWVFKLAGPRDAVAPQSQAFESFVRSVRF